MAQEIDNHLLEEWLELELLHTEEEVAEFRAQVLSPGEEATSLTSGAFRSREGFCKAVRSTFGLDFETEDAPRQLGITAKAGPKPTRDLVSRRQRVARLVLSGLQVCASAEDDRLWAFSRLSMLPDVSSRCIQELRNL